MLSVCRVGFASCLRLYLFLSFRSGVDMDVELKGEIESRQRNGEVGHIQRSALISLSGKCKQGAIRLLIG